MGICSQKQYRDVNLLRIGIPQCKCFRQKNKKIKKNPEVTKFIQLDSKISLDRYTVLKQGYQASLLLGPARTPSDML